MGICNLYACIASPKTEDEFLTKNSIQFHSHLGYRLVGTFQNCGYKFHRWYDMVWMEKIIGEHKKIKRALLALINCHVKIKISGRIGLIF